MSHETLARVTPAAAALISRNTRRSTGFRHAGQIVAGWRAACSWDVKRRHVERERTMRYAEPGKPGSKITFKKRYQNFIGGKWAEPSAGRYFDDVTPVTGQPFCEVPRSDAADVER